MDAPYRLSKPVTITYDGADGPTTRTIEVVEMRDPTGEDMLLVDEYSGMLLVLQMIAALSGLTLAEVKKLPARDIGPLGDRAFAHLPGGPKTGGGA